MNVPTLAPGTWWPAEYGNRHRSGRRMHYAREDCAGYAECGRAVIRTQAVQHYDRDRIYCADCWWIAQNRYDSTGWPHPDLPTIV